MKIPAIKGKIGIWDYYVSTLTFQQVSSFVSKIDDQLYKSDSLKELIQRSITENYISIKDYIIKQPELFFNSLVLAVYDDYPSWREIEFIYDDVETYKMGLLEFPGNHKIFPVDGQHRVEGIKAALIENPMLADNSIAVLFIGHSSKEGERQRTRRLFTTLNRYAKPVTTDDIIALDEDDSAAILTREMLEEFDLFSQRRVVYTKQKAIPNTNKSAITSIITLYQANVEVFKAFYFKQNGKKLSKAKLEEILKFRPKEDEYKKFKDYALTFWKSFRSQDIIKDFLKSNEIDFAKFRNNSTGGNLIFRPIGFLPLVKSAIRINQKLKKDYSQIFKKFNNLKLNINLKPWAYLLWNPNEKKMIMNTSALTELMLTYLSYPNGLTELEIKKLREGYASLLAIEKKDQIDKILNSL